MWSVHPYRWGQTSKVPQKVRHTSLRYNDVLLIEIFARNSLDMYRCQIQNRINHDRSQRPLEYKLIELMIPPRQSCETWQAECLCTPIFTHRRPYGLVCLLKKTECHNLMYDCILCWWVVWVRLPVSFWMCAPSCVRTCWCVCAFPNCKPSGLMHLPDREHSTCVHMSAFLVWVCARVRSRVHACL